MSEVRHPEKIFRVSNPIPKKPHWIRVKAPTSKFFKSTDKILKNKKIITVCEEAACPNISECWQKKHATFITLFRTPCSFTWLFVTCNILGS